MLMRTKKIIVNMVCMLSLVLVLAIHPMPVGATDGSFSNMSFPGCDILLSTSGGATVNISAGTLHILVKQATTTLSDRRVSVPNMSVTQYTIHFVDFDKPSSNGLQVTLDVDGVVIADMGGSYPSACINMDLSQIPAFLRDGRVSPAAGDRLAIWCNKDQQNVDVWGIDNKSLGVRLAIFTVKELRAAGSTGVIKSAGGYGAVAASMDSQGNFWVAWLGGPFGATGRDSFGKGFNCQFN